MISEVGRVVSVDGDCLWVETIRRSTCDSCSAQKGCGQSMIAKWSGKTSLIRVLLDGRGPESYKFHDLVTVGIPERVVANGALLVYMTPLLLMMAALLVGNLAAVGELGSVVLAVLGFALGALLVRMHSYRNKDNAEVQPVLIDDGSPLQWVESKDCLSDAAAKG